LAYSIVFDINITIISLEVKQNFRVKARLFP